MIPFELPDECFAPRGKGHQGRSPVARVRLACHEPVFGERRSAMTINLHVGELELALTPEQETAIYRIVQEALTNTSNTPTHARSAS